jgi:hypothetical protein
MVFATDLTEEERRLGFNQAFVSNPVAGHKKHASIVPAVVYRVRDGERIIKLSTSEYSHQLFGRYHGTMAGELSPAWLPIDGPYTDAEGAVKACQAARPQTDPLAPRIQAVTPALQLRCPKCGAEFTLNADFLPIDSTQTCPSPACRITAATEVFGGYC